MEQIDLFEHPDLIPADVQTLFDAVDWDGLDYSDLKNLKTETEKLGYTFEYYLDAVAFNLRKL